MNSNYHYEKARGILKRLYNAPSKGAEIPSIITLKPRETRLQTIKYPPSIRVMNPEDGGEETTVTLQGVLCGKVLPPLTYKPSTKSISHIRNLRQQVKITGLGLPEFESALSMVSQVTKEFKAHVPTRSLTSMECVPYEGDASLEAHARYFTDRNLVPFAKNTPFNAEVDAHGILRSIQPDSFIHGPDNYVEYCRVETTEDGTQRHVAYNPSLFRIGDIVEIAFSFVAVPVKDGGYRMMLNLRALTLLNAEVREDAEKTAKESSESGECPAPKRKRLYLREEDKLEPAKVRACQGEGVRVVLEKGADMQID